MTMEIFGTVVIVIIMMPFAIYWLIASWFKPARWLFCKILPWHSIVRDYLHHDGASQHARCRWCGYEGMIDSQGGLF